MRSTILFYLCGLSVALLNPSPPSAIVLIGGLVVAAALAVLPKGHWPAALICGALWGSWHTAGFLAERPFVSASAELVRLRGVVATFPQLHTDRWRFEIEPPKPWRVGPPAPASRVAVTGTLPDGAPRLGQWCELYVRLRHAHALANRGAGDGERRTAARRITSRATVVTHPANQCASISPWYDFRELRNDLSSRIGDAVVDPAAAAVIRALAVADRSYLSAAQRQRMRATGTSHLLAISGLHVSLCAVWVFVIMRVVGAVWCCRKQSYPAVRLGWYGAMVGALVYAALAGFGTPAWRAACMVVGVAWAALAGRRAFGLDNLLGALFILTAYDPFSLLDEGLWLSFGAVAILFVLAQAGNERHGWLRRAWRTHCALALGLAPIVALLFGEIALLSPLANLVAVPWSSVFVVPLVLAGTALSVVSDAGAAVLWDMAGRLWSVLERLLDLIAKLGPGLSTRSVIGTGTVLPILGAGVLLAVPRGLPTRLLAVALLVAALAAREPRLRPGALALTVLDVGQGLSVLVRTRNHVLLYDTGPSWWGRERGAGEVIVVPALARLGIAALDALVISHGDSDHAGGLGAVRAAFDSDILYAPPGSELGVKYARCLAPATWRWDGVEFAWLHPHPDARGSRNDLSCVLAISSPYGRVLLSGDIEHSAERDLLERGADALQAEVLIVPHHGSRTSSGKAFVAAVAPRYALISAGFGNRYGLPDEAVVAAYRAGGSKVLNTATAGAVAVELTRHGARVQTARERRRGFWTVSLDALAPGD